MSITSGMDLAEVEDLGRFLQERSERLRRIVHEVNRAVYSLPWEGGVAVQFGQQHWPAHRARLQAAADQLHGLAQSALNNAAEQRAASAAGGNPSPRNGSLHGRRETQPVFLFDPTGAIQSGLLLADVIELAEAARHGVQAATGALAGFPVLSVMIGGTQMAYYASTDRIGSQGFADSSVATIGTIAAFGVGATVISGAGAPAAAAFGVGMGIGSGLDWAAESLTGRSISGAWVDRATTTSDRLDTASDSILAAPTPQTQAEWVERNRQLNELQRKAHEESERMKNPWNALGSMLSI